MRDRRQPLEAQAWSPCSLGINSDRLGHAAPPFCLIAVVGDVEFGRRVYWPTDAAFDFFARLVSEILLPEA
jgi:hypothetical protein